MPNPRWPVKRIHFARLAAGVLIGLAISSGGAKAQVVETFEVINLLDRGSGSLRAAILAANASTAGHRKSSGSSAGACAVLLTCRSSGRTRS